MIKYIVNSCFFSAFLILTTLSISCANKVNSMNIFNFINKIRSEYYSGYQSIMDDIPAQFYVYKKDERRVWYKTKPFSLDNVIIETVSLRMSEGEVNPILVNIDVKGECIKLEDLKRNYPEIALTNIPRSDAPGAKTYYTTSADKKNITMSFGFTNESPDCLSNVVIKIKDERDYDIIPGK